MYPFSTWRLFSNLAGRGEYYDLRLHLPDGQICYFSACQAVKGRVDGGVCWKRIQQLGNRYPNSLIEPKRILRAQFAAIGVNFDDAELVHIKNYLGDHLEWASTGKTSESDLEDLGRASDR